MANAITSKEFNSKKAAQAAARKVYGADYADKVSIDTLDEKWYVSEYFATSEEAQTDAEKDAMVREQETPDVTVEPATNAEPSDATTSTNEPDNVAPAGLLAGLCGIIAGTVTVQEPAAPAPKAEPKTTGLIIEKNRPEQNGVKRPSAGGLCRAVWDACWAHQEITGTPPTAKEVKAIAETNGWNTNNASIEYYQWRKFNGIAGRVAKASPAQAEVETKAEGE